MSTSPVFLDDLLQQSFLIQTDSIQAPAGRPFTAAAHDAGRMRQFDGGQNGIGQLIRMTITFEVVPRTKVNRPADIGVRHYLARPLT